MPVEPKEKRTIAFVDGQNLFYAIKHSFGFGYPNYDPLALGETICKNKGWKLSHTRFYTGMPDQSDNLFWHHFWSLKLASMGKRGIYTYSRHLRYRNQTIILSNGKEETTLVGQEKGIDIRIALDIVRLARKNEYDVALIFSQDQDLSEVADEVRAISKEQGRWIKLACAFPVSPTYRNDRGIHGSEWIRFDRKTYAQCLDPNDYRLKKVK